MNDFGIFIWVFICGFPSLILWLIMLYILDTKGEPVNYSFVMPSQYKQFWRIIKSEENRINKVMYNTIFWAQIALFLIFIL